jgi:hypothetical protein
VRIAHPDWDRQARVFPGPSGSRPARSLIYIHGGDTYKATIGRPRKRYPRAPCRSVVPDAPHRGEGQESGNRVIAIVVTDTLVEVWSKEPSDGWANPSLVPHGEVLSIQYLGPFAARQFPGAG